MKKPKPKNTIDPTKAHVHQAPAALRAGDAPPAPMPPGQQPGAADKDDEDEDEKEDEDDGEDDGEDMAACAAACRTASSACTSAVDALDKCAEECEGGTDSVSTLTACETACAEAREELEEAAAKCAALRGAAPPADAAPAPKPGAPPPPAPPAPGARAVAAAAGAPTAAAHVEVAQLLAFARRVMARSGMGDLAAAEARVELAFVALDEVKTLRKQAKKSTAEAKDRDIRKILRAAVADGTFTSRAQAFDVTEAEGKEVLTPKAVWARLSPAELRAQLTALGEGRKTPRPAQQPTASGGSPADLAARAQAAGVSVEIQAASEALVAQGLAASRTNLSPSTET